MSYYQIFFRHTSQKILIYILTTLALKTNHISNYLAYYLFGATFYKI